MFRSSISFSSIFQLTESIYFQTVKSTSYSVNFSNPWISYWHQWTSSVLLPSFQISRWFELTLYRGCPTLFRNKLTILKYKLSSLINNAISRSIDHSFVTQDSNTMLSSAVTCSVFRLSDIHWSSSGKVTNTEQTWTVQSFEQYFKLCVISHWGTLLLHG
jgi:hypothetical protein